MPDQSFLDDLPAFAESTRGDDAMLGRLVKLLYAGTYSQAATAVGLSTGTGASASTTSNGTSNAASTGNVTIPHLQGVSAGDLITADFMNTIVDRLNMVTDLLARRLVHETQPASVATTANATAGTAIAVGLVQGVAYSPADNDGMMTVTFPAGETTKNDFLALAIGPNPIDPETLIEKDGKYTIKVDAAAYASGANVTVVSKSGTSVQAVKGLIH